MTVQVTKVKEMAIVSGKTGEKQDGIPGSKSYSIYKEKHIEKVPTTLSSQESNLRPALAREVKSSKNQKRFKNSTFALSLLYR